MVDISPIPFQAFLGCLAWCWWISGASHPTLNNDKRTLNLPANSRPTVEFSTTEPQETCENKAIDLVRFASFPIMCCWKLGIDPYEKYGPQKYTCKIPPHPTPKKSLETSVFLINCLTSSSLFHMTQLQFEASNLWVFGLDYIFQKVQQGWLTIHWLCWTEL